ncbi:MAG: hypothetical protein GYA63_09300, partial [Armatimonadetes bacterium]|nr:hypothetical protein [Armatimonadota bacterium]
SESAALTSFTMSVPFPGDEGGGGSQTNPPPDLRRNFEKFSAHTFLLLDTNAVALNDTNLYNALLSFPPDTNTAGTLQIAKYESNVMLIKANHFDYSAEGSREFALLICDRVDAAIWKSVDLHGSSDATDGWLVQGTVPAWKVRDPMFLMVSNVAQDCNAFFCARPYGGPQVELTGQSPYDVVSNSVTLQVSITDLSGVTNEQFAVNVDGLPARWTLGTGNTLNLETKYHPNGIANVSAVVLSDNARVYDPANPPADSKLFFSGTSSLPLDFENEMFLAFASDMCPTNVGTNYILFSVDRPQQIAATISNPSTGQPVASFAGYVPYPATVAIPWNFTEADGVTPYAADTYAVTFTASATNTITTTNSIDREGVRTAAGCFLTWQWEDPGDRTGVGPFLNQEAETWITGALRTLYLDLYGFYSLTQYTPGVVGANRNQSGCVPYTPWVNGWTSIMPGPLSNSAAFSDLTIGQAHGTGATIGGGDYLYDKFTTSDLLGWVRLCGDRTNWRLRKAALWTCYNGDPALSTAGGTYPSWPDACGIRDGAKQHTTYMRKNCGLFFGGGLPQGGYGGQNVATARVACFLDQTWVCGKYQWPGACDPTYSFDFAVQATVQQYPELADALPMRFGYGFMIYSSIYEDELMMLNNAHVKSN